MLLYYITDRTQFSGDDENRRRQLLERIAEAARLGVDFIQLREKDLSGRDLEALTTSAVERVRSGDSRTRLLINSRTDVAIAAGADGVHLRSNDISPKIGRDVWHEARPDRDPIIAVSCHTVSDVVSAKTAGADFVVFGTMFEKKGRGESVAGIEGLRSVCQSGIRVLALGGVTTENAAQCVDTGAIGVAGIRLFQEGDLKAAVKKLRAISPGR